MGKHIFKKKEAPLIRGLCVFCEKNLQKRRANGTYTPLCSSCDKKFYEKKKAPKRRVQIKGYRKYKQTQCSKCGFVPEHRCQLDVDHIDGNHNNNDPTNLQTLCANCHRLKTYLERQTPEAP